MVCYSVAVDETKAKLRNRLENIWKPPDFTPFFKKFSKRPVHTIKKGSLLFNEGDPLNRLYLITKGFIKMYRVSEDGRETTIYLFGPGYVLGVRALTSEDESAKHYAEAMTDVNILTLSRQEYFDALTEHPEYLVDLIHVFIDRLNHAEKRLEGFITTDTTARVANFLSDCVKRFCSPREAGKKKNGQVTLPIELTHQRIAEFVGSFRETVTHSLQKLEQEKIIRMKRGKITILNPKKLSSYASLKRHSL